MNALPLPALLLTVLCGNLIASNSIHASPLTQAELNSKSIGCGGLIEGSREKVSCKIRQEPFVVSGAVGMAVYVTMYNEEVLGTIPGAPSYGITRWRYFYTRDCAINDSRVPVKIGYQDMFDWSNGWLVCPVEGGGLHRKVIHNEFMEPMFWISNIFF
jgi:hypothetical protein